MLSYKEYKQLNESLYGAINLGIKTTSSITAPLGATGASEVVEAEGSEDSIEEAKCGKMMKKGMDCDAEKEDEEMEDEVKSKKEDEKDEDESEDEDHEEEDSEKMMMKKKMKKKSKKEWNEILADFDDLLEGKNGSVVEQVKSKLEGIKKLLETKEMTAEEKAWWDSVNSQIGPGDLGFAPIGKITQALR
jgi:hypothetical protein